MNHARRSPAASPAPPVPAALSAFLRGIERRAYVLALSQCAEPALARDALAQTVRSFRSVCIATPLSGWPASFWALLLAQPELTRGRSGLPELATLSSGPRAALLLRLVAGLDFSHAAQVLGVPEPAFRYASQSALQQLGEAGISYAALSALRERLHRQIKALPEADVEAVTAARERALAEHPPALATVAPSAAPGSRRLLWGGLAALVLAFAATFWPPAKPPPPTLPPGTTQPLPPVVSSAPARRVPTAADTVSHPDYPQLAEPELAALAADTALLSWLAGDPEAAAAIPDLPDETPPTAKEPDDVP